MRSLKVGVLNELARLQAARKWLRAVKNDRFKDMRLKNTAQSIPLKEYALKRFAPEKFWHWK